MTETMSDVKETIADLIHDLYDNDNAVRIKAAESLGDIGTEIKEAIPALIHALADEVSLVRSQAAFALAKMGQQAREAIPAIIHLLSDNNSNVRIDAARALEKIGVEAKEAIPALIKVSSDECSWVRLCAVRALGEMEIETKEVIPVLIGALSDQDEWVRHDAALILARLGQKEGLNLLRDVLVNKEDSHWGGSCLEPLCKLAEALMVQSFSKAEQETLRIDIEQLLSALRFPKYKKLIQHESYKSTLFLWQKLLALLTHDGGRL